MATKYMSRDVHEAIINSKSKEAHISKRAKVILRNLKKDIMADQKRGFTVMRDGSNCKVLLARINKALK